MTENITKNRQPSCDKCFHYGICPTWDSWNDKPYADGYSDGCQKYSNFKDKSRIIELPCKVGDEIYVLNRGNIPQKMILDAPDIRCHCPKESSLCLAICGDTEHNICAYRFKNDGSDIGEKVFLTKEEAEAKLKELNNER